jgi:hypothetical protein
MGMLTAFCKTSMAGVWVLQEGGAAKGPVGRTGTSIAISILGKGFLS